MHPINIKTLNFYARTNEKLLKGPVRAIILEFPGLDGGSCLGGVNGTGDYTGNYAAECGEQGALLCYCFTGPWSWMNAGAVKITDAIVDVIFDKYSLPENTAIVSTGGSMGGQGALIYSCSAKRTPTACAANGPACDVITAYDAHPDFPRTFYRAVAEYDMNFIDALKSISPFHRISDMPFIPYYIIHCGADEVLPPEKHSDIFVAKMRSLGHDVIYVEEPERHHCDITPSSRAAFNAFIYEQAKKNIS